MSTSKRTSNSRATKSKSASTGSSRAANATKTTKKTTRKRSTTSSSKVLNELKGTVDAINRSQAVIEFNLDGTIITANDNFLNAVGYTLDEIQGRHHRMFVAEAYGFSDEYKLFWQKLNHGEFSSGEYQRFGKNGKVIWIQASYNPVYDGKSNVCKVIKFATDITEQKNLNADYQGQINAVSKSQAVIEFNLDGTIITANDNFLNAVGYTLDEIQGQHHRMFVDPSFAGSSEYRDFWGQLKKGEFKSGEFRRLNKQGDEIWIQASYNPIMDMNGDPFKVVKYASDITAQKLAAIESRSLASMLQGAGAMFMTCDKDLIITYVNPAVERMLRQYEADIKKLLPGFDVNKLVGTCIDSFHKHPEHQRKLLTDTSNLPVTSELTLGKLTFGVTANALYDENGDYMGNGVEWTDYNAREDYRREVDKLIEACDAGDLNVRGDESVLDEIYSPMMAGINKIVDAIVEPINEASNALDRMAKQDLTARMLGEYQGDHAKIKDNFNSAADILQEALSSVADSAGQVSSASGQISEGSQKLAEGANTQASSIEEISASLEEMSSMTNQNADNASEAKNLANTATTSAQKGNSTMGDMKEAIDAIKASSDETAKIVKTIDEIAFQTNLLALNAAVEAARAGDAGKGFAVVAEEVRSLAQRSAEAAKNTAELIEQAVKNADNGVNITTDVQQILSEIFEGSTKVNDLISEIAAASKEQADGITQVSDAVDQMNRVTQENAANSEQSAAAAGQLNTQVAQLTELINTFELGVQQQRFANPAVPSATSQSVGSHVTHVTHMSHATPSVQTIPAPRKVTAAAAIPLDDDELSDF